MLITYRTEPREKNLVTLILGDNYRSKIAGMIILSFINVVLLSATVL